MRRLKNIYLEITTACNLNCPFCPSTKIENRSNLSLEEFKRRVDEVAPFTEGIYLHILGEPLLHKDLKEMIDYASKKVKVNITTNGRLLESKMDELISSNLSILNISLQSLITENEEYILHYMNTLNTFLNRKKEENNKLAVHIRLWNDESKEEVKKMNDFLLKFMDQHHFKDFKNVNIMKQNEFRWPTLTDQVNLNKTSCLGGIRQLGIKVSGEVVLCCLDYLGDTAFANVLNSPFSEIINSEGFKKIQALQKSKIQYFDLCKKCTFRNRFK